MAHLWLVQCRVGLSSRLGRSSVDEDGEARQNLRSRGSLIFRPSDAAQVFWRVAARTRCGAEGRPEALFRMTGMLACSIMREGLSERSCRFLSLPQA